MVESLPMKEVVARMASTITRPLRLLIFSPIVLFLSLYAAFAFGLLFLLFTSFAVVFKGQYGWSTGISGLAYIGLGIGMFASVVIQARFGGVVFEAQRKRNGKSRPEDRLLITAYAAPILPAGMFWYGWCVDKQTHWILPILGTVLIGFGIVCVMVGPRIREEGLGSAAADHFQMPQMIYLVEVYGATAGASALAANTVLRCIAGAFVPLAGTPMYDNLGLGWGNSLLGFLAVAFIPVPWVLGIYGEKIRRNSKFTL